MHRKITLLAVSAALLGAGVVSGCGGDDEPSPAAASTPAQHESATHEQSKPAEQKKKQREGRQQARRGEAGVRVDLELRLRAAGDRGRGRPGDHLDQRGLRPAHRHRHVRRRVRLRHDGAGRDLHLEGHQGRHGRVLLRDPPVDDGHDHRQVARAIAASIAAAGASTTLPWPGASRSGPRARSARALSSATERSQVASPESGKRRWTLAVVSMPASVEQASPQ